MGVDVLGEKEEEDYGCVLHGCHVHSFGYQ